MDSSRKAHYAEAKRLIERVKDVPCADCGHKFPTYVMDFDHVRGEKSFNISRGRGHSIKKLKEEIAKCDIVCANCHRIRLFSSRSGDGSV